MASEKFLLRFGCYWLSLPQFLSENCKRRKWWVRNTSDISVQIHEQLSYLFAKSESTHKGKKGEQKNPNWFFLLSTIYNHFEFIHQPYCIGFSKLQPYFGRITKNNKMHLTNLGFEPQASWFLILSFTTILSGLLTISQWNMHITIQEHCDYN